MRSLLIALALLLAPAAAFASCPSYPYQLTNGQTADANQVMANFNNVLTCVNNVSTGLATSGANSNITSLSGLTTPLSVFQGGTGATTGPGAQTNLGGPFLTTANNLSDVSSVTASLAHLGGAPLASPSFSGVPTAPTASPGTNTTQIATTAFVAAAAASPAYALFQQQKSSGTASGEAISATTWTHRNLNTTVVNTIPGASLGTNQISLPAGTYAIQASATAVGTSLTGEAAIRLRNVTASSTILVSPNVYYANIQGNGAPTIEGYFVLSGTTTLEIDEYLSQTGSGGFPLTNGEVEVYVSVALEKIG